MSDKPVVSQTGRVEQVRLTNISVSAMPLVRTPLVRTVVFRGWMEYEGLPVVSNQ